MAQQPKPKRVPQRMCIACRQIVSKRALVRLVRTPDGIQIDPSGKLAGRGAYLHVVPECWQKATEANLIARALRTKIDKESRQRLQDFAQTLPDNRVVDNQVVKQPELSEAVENESAPGKPGHN